jgi:asparagine synthase (glutamine-hydrolysing)
MCGINGQFAYHSSAQPVQRVQTESVRDAMQRRGPDGTGYWQSADARVALAHRRLAIIDLDARAAQPMHSADGALSVCFNGEIYNYQELKRQLQQLGQVFRTESDTEVLLYGYRVWGLRALLEKLRGMFAFALYDQQKQQLHLARDPLGIKPLYLADDGRRLIFASSVKALLTHPEVDRSIDPGAQLGFYLWASVPEPLTWHRAIQALPAGHFQSFDAQGAAAPASYVDMTAHYLAKASDASAQEQVRAALRSSVQAHLIADVPVGAFLSAGVDSGALLALMREQHIGRIQTCTLRFAEFIGSGNDEAPLAQEIASRYGAEHACITIDKAEFLSQLSDVLSVMDQPSLDGFNTYMVSRAAHQAGLKVALSGVGGDELFAGYASFQSVPQLHRMRFAASLPLMSPLLRRLAAPIARVAGLSPKAPAVFELARDLLGSYQIQRGLFMPWELAALLPAETIRVGLARLAQMVRPRLDKLLTPLAAVSLLETTLYMRNQLLRDTDWASMAHSLEVRTPFVDVALHRALAPLLAQFAQGRGKALIANAPTLALPESILQRPKTGFATPASQWLQTDPRFDGWQRYGFLREARQHWSRRFAVAIADQFQR